MKWVRWALYVAAFFAITTMWSVLATVLPYTDVADELSLVVAQSTAAEEAGARDFFRVVSNLIYVVFLTVLTLFVVLLVRYVRLLRTKFNQGDPSVLAQIRRLAWLQVWMQVASAALLWMVFSDLETTSVDVSWGPGVVIGPILLYLTQRADVRRYFSHFVIRVAPSGPAFANTDFFQAPTVAAVPGSASGIPSAEPPRLS